MPLELAAIIPDSESINLPELAKEGFKGYWKNVKKFT